VSIVCRRFRGIGRFRSTKNHRRNGRGGGKGGEGERGVQFVQGMWTFALMEGGETREGG